MGAEPKYEPQLSRVNELLASMPEYLPDSDQFLFRFPSRGFEMRLSGEAIEDMNCRRLLAITTPAHDGANPTKE